jgi:outer membrane protein
MKFTIIQRALVTTVLLLVVSSSFAQKLWTLEECINTALSGNIQIKQQQLNAELSRQHKQQSVASLFPSVNGSATYVYNYGQTIDPYTNQFASARTQSNNFYLSSSITVFNGFQLLNTIFQRGLDYKASLYDLEKMKNDISLGVATAYLQVLYNSELKDIATSQLAITKQQVDRMQKLYDAGSVAKGSLLTLQAQQASEEYQLVNAQNQLEMSYITLSQLMELPTADGLEIVKPTLANPDASSLLSKPEEIFNKALTIQPEIKSAEIKLQSAKKGVCIAWGSISPNLTLNGSWGTGYSGASKEVSSITQNGLVPIGSTMSGEIVYAPTYTYDYTTKSFNDQIKSNENKSVGLYLNVPIFNKWQSKTAIATAKISYKNYEYQLQATKNQLSKTIQQAFADAMGALNRYDAASKSVDALQESFKYTEQKYNVGMVNATDYNDAKNKLAKSQSDLLQAKYEYVFRLTVLDFYQGRPLKLN